MHVETDGIPECEQGLPVSDKSMRLYMNLFSRTFDKIFYSNAVDIFKKLKEKNPEQ